MNIFALISFAVVLVLTLGVTFWANRRVRDESELYAAGGRVSALQNGLAITGDFVSAAAIFGSVALFYLSGVSMVLFLVAPLVGICLLLLFVAGPLRRLGKYTVGDVLVAKLGDARIKLFAGVCTIALSLMYVVAQLVAAGSLFSILLDIPFAVSVAAIGLLVTIYVSFGGMLATTWLQIIKAAILISGVLIMSVLAVGQAGGFEGLYARASASFGGDLANFSNQGLSLFSLISLSAGLVLGMMGMPHLLVRFLTVPNARAAEQSAFLSALFVALVLGLLLFAIGPATLAFVKGQPAFESAPGVIKGGENIVFLHLATALGGELLFGFMSAVAFATILAVVAGLGVAMASTAANDIFRPLVSVTTGDRWSSFAFRLSAAVTTFVGVLLALVLQHENIAFLSALAFGIAAGTNFPILLLALYWPRLTTAGAIAGGIVGLGVSLGLLIVGPTVWQKLLGHGEPLFPSDYTTLVAFPAALIVSVVVSLSGAGVRRRSLEAAPAKSGA
ncbi:MAG: cation acetate symporter [Pseudomonadota bacterium]|nr:cation acetate symporter [Pseudomonadota bacterium]